MAAATGSLGELTTIFNCLSSASKAFSSADELYQVLTGTDGTQAVVAAIQALENAVNQGIQELVAAVTDETWQEQWQPFSNTIANIQTGIANISSDFSTLSFTGNVYTVNVGAYIPFNVWAGGGSYDNVNYDSAIQKLWDLAQLLWDLFQVGGIADNSILTVWGQLFELGSANVVQNFAGQTSLTAYFLLMQQIYGMLSSIFYYHETILALYVNTYGNQGNFSSLSSTITTNFGDVTLPSTVWGQFASVMNNWPALGQDFKVVATSGDSWPGGDDCNVINAGGGKPGAAQFWNQWTRTSQYPQYSNAVFTNLAIGIDSSNSSDFPNYYLVGTLAEVLPGVTFSQQSDNITSYNAAQMNDNGGEYVISVNGETTVCYVNVTYNTPPGTLNANCYWVITGFSFVTVYGNRLGLQLEFSQLDLNNPESPVVTLLGDGTVPVGTYFGIEGDSYTPQYVNYIDLRPSATTVGFPIDNVSLVETFGTFNGNRIGLLVRTGWAAFQAPFMQPDGTLAPNGFSVPTPV